MPKVQILILDFGSQYTQLIVRKLRELHIYALVVPYQITAKEIQSQNPKGLIFSGGPSSVYSHDSYFIDKEIFDLDLPILGICYGMQLIAHYFKAKVKQAKNQEYGKAKLKLITPHHPLLKGIKQQSIVWMSHADEVVSLPKNFSILASSDSSTFSIIAHQMRSIFALQFHPEVQHSEQGMLFLRNFCLDIAKAQDNWTTQNFIKDAISEIKNTVGTNKIICALSGGVDSSVTAMLLHKAIGDQLVAIFIDNGLLRLNEAEIVKELFLKNLKLSLITIDASAVFLSRLKNISDPEQKRKIIGKTFIDVFSQEARKLDGVKYLAQGTLYPDIIESVSVNGPSKTIKTHHNVGGLPKDMEFELVEPLKMLFKDEVRALGLNLGLSKDQVYRHPFPGPGLSVRILGEVNQEKCDILRQADAIFIDILRQYNWYDKVWQAFTVLIDSQSVGVMGDNRTYEFVLALRSVQSFDAMTATFSHLPYELLELASKRIINEVKNVNRVVYDISSKPPATIEWE